jgi:hypothetical protein
MTQFFKLYDREICWGDSIQQARIVPYLAPHTDAVLVESRELVRLFSKLGMHVVAFDELDQDARDRATCSIADVLRPGVPIPRGYQWELPTLWADETVPFNPDPSLLQVGLCWHGSGGGRSAIGLDDDWRCIPPEMLLPLLAVPGVQFTALHFTDHAQAQPALENLSELGVWDFAGTAGVMRKLDLVITIDTSVAHLAGNLGVPTWLMLVSPKHSGWDGGRWACVPPLYPSVRQFRQETPGDWSTVIAEVEAELRMRIEQP